MDRCGKFIFLTIRMTSVRQNLKETKEYYNEAAAYEKSLKLQPRDTGEPLLNKKIEIVPTLNPTVLFLY